MKCKVLIYDMDQSYQNRLILSLREKFAGIMEIVPCHNAGDLGKLIESQELSLIVIGERASVDFTQIPDAIGVCYLVEFRSKTELNGKKAICKYQKITDIGMQLAEYSMECQVLIAQKREEERKAELERIAREKREEEERIERERIAEQERIEREKREEEERLERERIAKEEEERRLEEQRIREEEERKAREEMLAKRRSNPRIVIFISAADGDGSATTAFSCGLRETKREIKSLMVNLRPGKGESVIVSGVSRRDNLGDMVRMLNDGEMTIEDFKEFVATDANGVDSIGTGRRGVLLSELETKGLEAMLSLIKESVSYDSVIVNVDMQFSPLMVKLLQESAQVVLVGNGSDVSNYNLEKFIKYVQIYDETKGSNYSNKLTILYNKFLRRKSKPVNQSAIPNVGQISIIDGRSSREIVSNMAQVELFDQIVFIEK